MQLLKQHRLTLLLTALLLLSVAFANSAYGQQAKAAPAKPPASLASAPALSADDPIASRDAKIAWLEQQVQLLQSRVNGLMMYYGATDGLTNLEKQRPPEPKQVQADSKSSQVDAKQ
jgi:hypothetical protein